MQNLYYVEKKNLEPSGDFEGTEKTFGTKTIRVYDVNTQDFSIVEILSFETINGFNTEDKIRKSLEADLKLCPLIEL